jgi:hypothetical protein
MKTVSQVRKAFWEDCPEFKNHYRKTYRQNQYHVDIRCAFVDFVDYLQKNGEISENLANRVTL